MARQKATFSHGLLAPGHLVDASYMRNSTEQGRPSFSFTIDPAATINRTLPNDLWVATYRGAASSRLFTELQVSQKKLGFRGNGGTLTDIVESPFVTLTQRLAHYNAPYFDATDPQDRDNRQITGSATYYLDSSAIGTHSISSSTTGRRFVAATRKPQLDSCSMLTTRSVRAARRAWTRTVGSCRSSFRERILLRIGGRPAERHWI